MGEYELILRNPNESVCASHNALTPNRISKASYVCFFFISDKGTYFKTQSISLSLSGCNKMLQLYKITCPPSLNYVILKFSLYIFRVFFFFWEGVVDYWIRKEKKIISRFISYFIYFIISILT